jgi:hypothetical protein
MITNILNNSLLIWSQKDNKSFDKNCESFIVLKYRCKAIYYKYSFIHEFSWFLHQKKIFDSKRFNKNYFGFDSNKPCVKS